jgi:ribosomal protein L12E/L44/L45/RPP1/RPP2
VGADQEGVTPLVSTLSSLTSDRLIDDKSGDLTGYGLANPSETITVTKKDGKTETVLLGDDTPTQSGTFAKLANDPRIFTIASYTKSGLDKTIKDLRDKRLLTFNSDKITRVTLNAIEFGKSGAIEWQILKPKPLRADGAQVDELVRKLKDAKIDTAISDEDAKKAAAAFASGVKAATASVTDPSGTQTIEIRASGKDKDKTYYAKSSVVEGIWKVPNDLGDLAAKTADDFRNKKLFDFGFSEPNKVEVGTYTFTKNGDKWTSGSTQMDSASVQSVIDKLRDLAATKFPEAGGGDSYLAITVSSDSGKKTEKVLVTKKGDTYFAVRDGEPGVYQLDGKSIDELQKAAASVKQYTPPKAADTKKK